MHTRLGYPRPEYPRPDRQRGMVEGIDWLNLNGPWQFRFDGNNSGIDEAWFNNDQPLWPEQIIVPFCWESLAAWGEGDAAGNDNYYATRIFRNPLEVNRSNHRSAPRYEIGWYRRRVEIPQNKAWQDKRVILTVGAADFFTDCWCNGVHQGRHEGGYTPFEFDITDALSHAAESGLRYADIVLRVEDPMDNAEQPVGKQWQWYTTTSGIWQTVYIEPRHSSFIDSFRIVTDIDTETVQFLFECTNAEEHVVSVEAISPAGAAFHELFAVKDGFAEGMIEIPEPELWDPNHPNLYKVVLRLQRGGCDADVVHTYFGMRKIDAATGEDGNVALRLNGKPRYLRGALYQAYFVDGVYTATDLSVLHDDIAYAIKSGFNFLRVHIKIDDPLLLYLADTMGMLLMCDFPNFGEGGDTPTGRRRFEETMMAAVRRDFNHPSIVAWCLFNETWGFGGQVELVKWFPQLEPAPADIRFEKPGGALSAHAPTTEETEAEEPVVESGERKLENRGAHEWVQNIWELAKALDSTRLIEDMSVVHWAHLDYYQHGDTDINSWHFYINNYERAREHIEQIAASTYAGSNFNYVEGYAQRSQPLINSEYGGVGALDGIRDCSWSFKFLTSELRRQGKIAAYIYTELHDVEWEHNGFLNYDRTPKEFGYDPLIINSANVLPIDAPPVARHEPGSTVKIDVSSSHYSTKPYRDVFLHWRLSGIDACGMFHNDVDRGCVEIDFPHRAAVHAHTIEVKMPETPMLCILDIRAITHTGETVASNFIYMQASSAYPPSREEGSNTLTLRGLPNEWSEGWWTGAMSDREGAAADDSCYGEGWGFYEWSMPLDIDLSKVRRIRILGEISSRRSDTKQTDGDKRPTTLQIQLNGLRVRQTKIDNHPHDARGVLSYLRGGRGEFGAYGYLAHATVEGDLLRDVLERSGDNHLRLRFAVPEESVTRNGMTIYGAECGRFPLPPTVILDW